MTRDMVFKLADSLTTNRYSSKARDMFKQIVTAKSPPEFITTYLNESSAFLGRHFFD